ncbi:MAG: alpha/beta hydrolase [Alphaproteobacteria bacterium]|jgi:pimeloyl-ACP methyl ester carboxylesterase|nr:alpha/beta hydrolase [Alphaproteobacteria bacterium]
MKKNLVMLPALMCDERLFEHQIQMLEPYFNIKVFTFKDIDNIKNAAKYIVEEMGDEKFHVCGISMGGYIALELMRHTENIESLVLINTSFYEDNLEKKAQRFMQIEEAMAVNDFQFKPLNDNIIKAYLHNASYKKTSLLEKMAKDIGRLGFINQQKLILSRKSAVEDFQYYNIPTLIVSGSQDIITPTFIHEEMVNNLKDGTLVSIDNCGHLSPLDQPEALSAVLELWFKRV